LLHGGHPDSNTELVNMMAPKLGAGPLGGFPREAAALEDRRNGPVNRAEGLTQAEQAPQARDLRQVRGFSLPRGGLEDGAPGDAKMR
jgi:hypothetical protein